MKIYQKTWFIILMLIGLPPIGMFLIWKQNKFNKVIRIILTIVFSIITLFDILLIAVPSDNTDVAEPTTAATQSEEIKSNTTAVTQSKEVKNNTTAMVNQIIAQAKQDAKESTNKDDKEAITYLSDNINNCFVSNEIMEKFIYYGALLDAKYDDKEELSKIGFQAVKTVKYVYRGVEAITDPTTANNVRELREMLKEYINSNN